MTIAQEIAKFIQNEVEGNVAMTFSGLRDEGREYIIELIADELGYTTDQYDLDTVIDMAEQA